jgi:hypothetical protein
MVRRAALSISIVLLSVPRIIRIVGNRTYEITKIGSTTSTKIEDRKIAVTLYYFPITCKAFIMARMAPTISARRSTTRTT